MKIGDKINQLRTMHGYTMQVLADKSGLTKGYISMLEKGINPGTGKEIIPSLETVQNIAYAFDLNLDSFLEGVEGSVELPLLSNDKSTLDQIISTSKQLTPPRQHKVYTFAQHQLNKQNNGVEESSAIYLVGQTAAGEPLEYSQINAEQINTTVPSGADYALTVKGDSMEPLIKDGSIIFYKEQPTVENGEVAIVEIKGGEVTCKKFYFNGEKVVLRSINDKYEDMIFEDGVRIIGKVIL
ncbi:helix-turn-helix domain-containing protein [Facklamia hominis]|uniref:helix-turn-helix domain-containing protein n=1 Tax=Facklamia hominis TaxID=178214 RepID=UPI000C7AF950|nr:XRE family transcriptional regulator [Facklamia hominis]PKY92465.1 hypothetical protein CYJ56_07685 [Facklamia hominis]WPJ90953.1 XRE family transcriptional regulator [Facklamia hominis]